MKTGEQKRLCVQEWKESGLTQKTYCEQIGVKRTTFANWVARTKGKGSSGFISIGPEKEPVREVIEVIYPNGVRIKSNSSHAGLLSQLVHLY